MKMLAAVGLVLLCAGCAAESVHTKAVVGAGTPIDKVVKLLEDLVQEGEQTGKADKEMFEKYKAWCEDALKKTDDAVKNGKGEIKNLESLILELTAKISKLEVKIKFTLGRFKKETHTLEQYKSMSDKKYQILAADIKELAQMVTYLQAAITVLQGAQQSRSDNVQAGYSGASLLELANNGELLAGIGAAARRLPDEAQLSPKKMALIGEFLSDMHQMKEAGKATYTPASSVILGMLKEMYENMKEQLALKEKEVETSGVSSREFIGTKTKEVEGLDHSLKELLETKVRASKRLAISQKEYDDAVGAYKADKAFYANTKLACQDKKAEYEARQKFREGEMVAINKAIEILTSEDAKKLFSKSMGKDSAKQVLFLQVGSNADRAPNVQAFKALKTAASQSHSVRLGQLAARVLAATGNAAFKEVITEIEKVMGVLREEEKHDVKWRDGCKEKYQDIMATVQDLDWKIKKNKAMIGSLEKLIEDKTNEKAKTIEELEDMAKEIKEMEDTRKDENKTFLTAKSDDEKAIALTESAKETLARFYESRGKGNVRSELLQKPKVTTVEYMEPPQFAKESKNQGGSKSIVQLMEMIIEDIQIAIIDDIKYEESAQAEYNEQMKNSKKIVAELEKKKVTLEELIADSEESKSDEEDKLKSNEGDLKDENDFHDKIEKNCDWILERFTMRAKARAAEMEAMTTAREFLSGAAVPSMLQKHGGKDSGAFLGRHSE